jgi:hypothetical protein
LGKGVNVVIKWPSLKRVRGVISTAKKLHRANGATEGKLRLLVAEDGEWAVTLTSDWDVNTRVIPALQEKRLYVATEDVDLTKSSSSEAEAKSLLSSVKEVYVLSHATLDEGRREMRKEAKTFSFAQIGMREAEVFRSGRMDVIDPLNEADAAELAPEERNDTREEVDGFSSP